MALIQQLQASPLLLKQLMNSMKSKQGNASAVASQNQFPDAAIAPVHPVSQGQGQGQVTSPALPNTGPSDAPSSSNDNPGK